MNSLEEWENKISEQKLLNYFDNNPLYKKYITRFPGPRYFIYELAARYELLLAKECLNLDDLKESCNRCGLYY